MKTKKIDNILMKSRMYVMYVSKKNIDKEYFGVLTYMHYVDRAQFSKIRSGLATLLKPSNHFYI